MQVILSLAACQHITLTMNERAWRDTALLGPAGAAEMRDLFLTAFYEHTDPMMFELNLPQLRALDMLLTDSDPREGKLPDGSPLFALVETVWGVLRGADDARGDGNRDAHVLADEAGLTTPG